MIKALHDLESARLVANAQPPILDVASYHCQQAAEKAVKAFLVLHGCVLQKTHDIEVLVDLATQIEPAMASLADAADILTPYATQFRYPSAVFAMEPGREEVEEALKEAKTVYEFVLGFLPPGARPV